MQSQPAFNLWMPFQKRKEEQITVIKYLYQKHIKKSDSNISVSPKAGRGNRCLMHSASVTFLRFRRINSKYNTKQYNVHSLWLPTTSCSKFEITATLFLSFSVKPIQLNFTYFYSLYKILSFKKNREEMPEIEKDTTKLFQQQGFGIFFVL